MLVGAGLVTTGLVANVPLAVQGLLIMFGSWLLVSKDFPAKVAAAEALDVRKRKKQALPKLTTTFYDSGISLSGEGKMVFNYNKLSRLTEDDAYFYLFLAKDSACMIDKQSLMPNVSHEFKAYLTEKTGLEWIEIKPWFHMNIFEIIKALRGSHKVL